MKSSGSVSGHVHAISLSLPVCRRTAQYIISIDMPHFVVCVADITIPQDKEQTQPIEEAKCCNHQCLHQIIEPCLSVEPTNTVIKAITACSTCSDLMLESAVSVYSSPRSCSRSCSQVIPLRRLTAGVLWIGRIADFAERENNSCMQTSTTNLEDMHLISLVSK
jgi:hypothetical protein